MQYAHSIALQSCAWTQWGLSLSIQLEVWYLGDYVAVGALETDTIIWSIHAAFYKYYIPGDLNINCLLLSFNVSI